MVNILFLCVMIPLLFLFSKNLGSLLFSYNEYSSHKRRLEQLRSSVAKVDKNTYETIEDFTEDVRIKIFPIIQDYLPSLKIDRREQLEVDLKTANWDDTFSAESFIALGLIMKMAGIILIPFSFILPGALKIIGCVIAACLIFGLDFWFNQDVKSSRTKLFKDFPDFIRIVSGYLSADIKLIQAITDSIKYVGESWRPILKQLVVDCRTGGTDFGFEQLKNNVDIFEVKEFVALVRLTLEMGGDVKEGFEQQAEKVAEMQRNILLMKIGQRKTLVTVVQAPLLLCNLVAIGLPTFGNIAEFLTKM